LAVTRDRGIKKTDEVTEPYRNIDKYRSQDQDDNTGVKLTPLDIR